MKNHWKAIDFANIPHGDFLRRQNEVLAPQWKFLIRKYEVFYLLFITFKFSKRCSF